MPSPETDLPLMHQTHGSKRPSITRVGQLHLRVWCLSHKAQAVTWPLSPGLAWSREKPAQNAWRPMRRPRVTGSLSGQQPSPNPAEPPPSQPKHSRDGAWRGPTTHS